MAFLDNSGDIILDAVLTDAGRKRLARGDGTFKIWKYAFGDDEINYGSYNPNDLSGSAYYDLEILQTPILEAFTDGGSSLKTKLVSIQNNNLLFLPRFVLNEVAPKTQRPSDSDLGNGLFLVAVNTTTANSLHSTAGALIDGKFLIGQSVQDQSSQYIRMDQGLNTTQLDASVKLDTDRTEQQYMIQMDDRFGTITDPFSQTTVGKLFTDDDQITTYVATLGVGTSVAQCKAGQITTSGEPDFVGFGQGDEVLVGPRGTKLRFGIFASNNLKSNDYLFDTIGQGTVTDGTTSYKTLDTTVKITGITTGFPLDIPIRFLKQTS
jgi:hypothetical protein